MAGRFISRKDIPVNRPVAGKDSVSVRANGQISLSTSATKALGDAKMVWLYFDDASRVLTFLSKAPKGHDESTGYKLGKQKKSNQGFFSGASVMQYFGYDYKASGNQTFDAKLNTEKHQVSFTLPEGALTPKPVVKRTRKAKGTAPANTATQEQGKAAGAGASAGASEPDEDEGPSLEEE